MINIPLPLMVYIKALQESQVHNKCLFCSIMSVIYVQIPPLFSVFGILVSVTLDKNFKKLYYKSKKHYFYIQNTSICWSRYVKKSTGNSSHNNGKKKNLNDIHNIDRNMANVFYNQSSRCFSNVYSIIYQPGQLAFQ